MLNLPRSAALIFDSRDQPGAVAKLVSECFNPNERCNAFVRKWRLRHRAVADSLEEAGNALFAFTRLPPSQWRSARTSNAIERLHEEFKRRIKTQTVPPSADTAAMLFCWLPDRSTCERSMAGRH